MAKIVGIEAVNYTAKATGREVRGFRIHTTYFKNTPNLNGVAVDSFFCNEETYRNYFDLPLGTEVEVFYNKYGTPCGCTVLERSK